MALRKNNSFSWNLSNYCSLLFSLCAPLTCRINQVENKFRITCISAVDFYHDTPFIFFHYFSYFFFLVVLCNRKHTSMRVWFMCRELPSAFFFCAFVISFISRFSVAKRPRLNPIYAYKTQLHPNLRPDYLIKLHGAECTSSKRVVWDW